MKIRNLFSNNIKELNAEIKVNKSLAIAGLSGSGKSTFSETISNELKKRILLLLPKSEYSFLFPHDILNHPSAIEIKELPQTIFLGKKSYSENPRSTIGTFTGVFKKIRQFFAKEHQKGSDFFSYNSPLSWCPSCKGRGSKNNQICTSCNGNRYASHILDFKVTIANKTYTIVDFNNISIECLYSIIPGFIESESEQKILKNIIETEIGYLSLGRVMSTLSGGEISRIYLSNFLATSKNVNIIIDEISIGLDKKTLNNIIFKLDQLGVNNNIWLIDHSDQVLKSSEDTIFFGPGSGPDGGKIVEESPRPRPIYYPINKERIEGHFYFSELKFRNIDLKKLSLPKNRIVGVTGASGCGKSTLINYCLIDAFKKQHPKSSLINLAQSHSKSITSLSTLATFLDIKKYLSKFEIDTSIDVATLLDSPVLSKLPELFVNKLNAIRMIGIDYLTLGRKINTLSTGEFQAVNLVKNIFNSKDVDLIILDEPSKGLSQNILNNFVNYLKRLVSDGNATILIIEHNDYILKNCDYLYDFGERATGKVTELDYQLSEDFFNQKRDFNSFDKKIKSKLETKTGVVREEQLGDKIFLEATSNFYGGYLKNLSQTASWIYGNYHSKKLEPTITLDFEQNLYSQDSFLFESTRLLEYLISTSDVINNPNIDKFDYLNKENHCKCCKGKGYVRTFDFDLLILNQNKGFWDGLFPKDIMKALKSFNNDKFKLLFSQVLEYTDLNVNLELAYNKMSEKEKEYFWYGFWEREFFDKSTKTKRYWQGLIHLIIKYIKINDYPDIKKSINFVNCPNCLGGLLSHSEELIVHGKDIREWLFTSIEEIKAIKSTSLYKVIRGISDIISVKEKINLDVSKLSTIQKAKLKLLQLVNSELYGFDVYLMNYLPLEEELFIYIEELSKNNRIIICDNPRNVLTKVELVDRFKKEFKIKKNPPIYELLGYTGITKIVREVKKKNACSDCKGKGSFKIEGLDESLAATVELCEKCSGTGLSDEGLAVKVNDLTLQNILNDSLNDLYSNNSAPNIKLNKSVDSLSKNDIYDLIDFLKELKK